MTPFTSFFPGPATTTTTNRKNDTRGDWKEWALAYTLEQCQFQCLSFHGLYSVRRLVSTTTVIQLSSYLSTQLKAITGIVLFFPLFSCFIFYSPHMVHSPSQQFPFFQLTGNCKFWFDCSRFFLRFFLLFNSITVAVVLLLRQQRPRLSPRLCDHNRKTENKKERGKERVNQIQNNIIIIGQSSSSEDDEKRKRKKKVPIVWEKRKKRLYKVKQTQKKLYSCRENNKNKKAALLAGKDWTDN